MSHRLSCTISFVLLALLAALGLGCDKKITITRIPTFYTPELTSIAVAPFRNQTNHRGAGDIIADRAAARLMANGSYRVFNRNDLRAVLDEKDLQLALSDDPGASAQLQKLTDVQAILVGTVNTFAATSNSQRRRDPVYQYDKKGNRYVAGYNDYVLTRNEANVSVTATLIRVSDGSTIYATPEALWSRNWAEGSPPKQDPNSLLNDAAAAVAASVAATFAPTRMEIKIDEGKALRTASSLYDNKWDFTKDFKPTDEKMYVVVALPASCDRNTFRIAIACKDGRENLVEQTITWDKQYAGRGYEFSPREIYEKGGTGEYEVKFYSGPEPVMRHKFKIR